MADLVGLKLQAWLSPAYPVGAYAYSHGLEWAVEAGDVTDAATLAAWIADVLAYGAGRNDSILLGEAWRAVPSAARLAEVAELGSALSPSRERQLETLQQGDALWQTTAAAWSNPAIAELARDIPARLPYPVALGAIGRAHEVPLDRLLPAFLAAMAGNLLNAAIRLGLIGQTDGQRLLASALPSISVQAAEYEHLGLEDLGGAAFRIDLASFHHETQHTRLFRS